MARLVSRAELARIAGKSDVAVSKQCKGRLAPACVGKRVNLDHPAVREWLGDKWPPPTAQAPTAATLGGAKRSVPPPAPRRGKATAAPPKPKAAPARTAPEAEGGPGEEAPLESITAITAEDIERYAHLSLTELTKRFGTSTAFKDWLAAHKSIEDIREKRLKNDELEGRLIPREIVRQHVFQMISSANTRLLRDVPKTVAGKLYSFARADMAVEEAEAYVRKKISEIIDPVKGNAARVLRNAGKGEKSDASGD